GYVVAIRSSLTTSLTEEVPSFTGVVRLVRLVRLIFPPWPYDADRDLPTLSPRVVTCVGNLNPELAEATDQPHYSARKARRVLGPGLLFLLLLAGQAVELYEQLGEISRPGLVALFHKVLEQGRDQIPFDQIGNRTFAVLLVHGDERSGFPQRAFACGGPASEVGHARVALQLGVGQLPQPVDYHVKQRTHYLRLSLPERRPILFFQHPL